MRWQDTVEDMKYIANKILKIRLFEDEGGSMWRKSIQDLQLEVLLVSQFTLYAKMKANKPDFHVGFPALPFRAMP